MIKLFDTWCEATEEVDGRKTLWRITEDNGTRHKILKHLGEYIQSHYISDQEVATFLEALDLPETAKAIRTLFPETSIGRSGDLGEILATELIEEWCDYDVPIRKLRDKDHRNQAMRGEDVIGVRDNEDGKLELLKAEAKSAQSLSAATVNEARAGLEMNDGRPSPHALIFIARRLLETSDEVKKELGKKLLAEANRRDVPKSRIAHLLFALTGNAAANMIDEDFDKADGGRDQFISHLRIQDHADFIKAAYDAAYDQAIAHADD